jgi:hypothetical protein
MAQEGGLRVVGRTIGQVRWLKFNRVLRAATCERARDLSFHSGRQRYCLPLLQLLHLGSFSTPRSAEQRVIFNRSPRCASARYCRSDLRQRRLEADE